MITLDALSKTVAVGDAPLTILHPLSLSIPAGQSVAIMGPSGSGKSTLLGLLAGLDAPGSGSVSINGQRLTDMNEDQLAAFRGRTIGFVFQSFQLIPTLTAIENVQVPMEIQGWPDPEQRATELLAAVGLQDRANHYPGQLSGGEQQRVAIARAYACRPPVLLADEPTGNLDTATGERIVSLLQRINAEEGSTLVLVTHDPEIANLAARIIQLRDGRVVSDNGAGNASGEAEAAEAPRQSGVAG